MSKENHKLVNNNLSLIYQNEAKIRNITLHNEQKALIKKLSIFKNNVEEQSNTQNNIKNNFVKRTFYNICKLFFKKNKNHHSRQNHIYLYGAVGRGKSFIMNILYNNIAIEQKENIHFYHFINNIHQKLHKYRHNKINNNLSKNKIIDTLSKNYAKEVKFLYIDEFQITDIADAMIIERIFKALIDYGVNIILTSNRAPEDLYKGGLQREKFLEFVNFICNKMQVINLDHDIDYRLTKKNLDHYYHFPLGKLSENFINQVFKTLTNDQKTTVLTIKFDNTRSLVVNNQIDRVALFSFKELCETPLFSKDYYILTQFFDSIIIKNIRQLHKEDRNEAKRFMTLIDELYEAKTLLVISAETNIESIYQVGDGIFEFDRTISRLKEMNSEEYIENTIYMKNNK